MIPPAKGMRVVPPPGVRLPLPSPRGLAGGVSRRGLFGSLGPTLAWPHSAASAMSLVDRPDRATLASHFSASVRVADGRRIARERASGLDPLGAARMGMLLRMYLFNPLGSRIEVFTLWQSPRTALDYVQGPLFAADVRALGRIRTTLLLPISVRPPPEGTRWIGRIESPTLDVPIRCHDPLRGADLAFAFGPYWAQTLELVACIRAAF
jgi:hypothetical protein